MRQVAAALALVLALQGAARAVEYELSIDIETEDDLYELLASEEITQETFDTLVELLRKGIDLNSADVEELYALPGLTLVDAEAIVAYRTAAGTIPDPGALVAAGVLREDKLAQMAPFLIVSRPKAPGLTVAGKVRYRALVTNGDGRIPAMAVDARASSFKHLTVGASVLLNRNSISDVRFDPSRGALSAEDRATAPRLAKIYALWRTAKFEAMVGTFQAGFGQALTFDDSPVYLPNGLYVDDAIYRSTDLVSGCIESSGELTSVPCPSDTRNYVSPDFRFRAGLFGVGLRARKLALGEHTWLEATAFLSRQVHDIYQYEIYDRSICADPNDDEAEECKAPPVFVRGDDVLAPSAKFRFTTLPDMWAELLGGGNVSLFAGRRSHVGATAWGARPTWLTDGIDLDFQEWSTFPRGGTYGAVGADAAYGRDWYDLGAEVTRTFDGGEPGGGLGVLGRLTATVKKSELELSLRHYDRNFVNPHNGAIAEPDEIDGQRARGEMGVRVRYAGKLSRRLQLRGLVDLWRQQTVSTEIDDTDKLRAELRGDYLITRQIGAGLYARYSDKDLALSGRGQCYDITFLETEDGEPIPCAGLKVDVGALATLKPMKTLTIGLQGQLRLIDDKRYMDQFRKDVAAVLKVNYYPMPQLRLQGRVRYDKPDLVGDIADDTFLEHTLWTYLQATYKLPRVMSLSARYELRAYLNEDERSYIRTPSPEHWFQMEVEAKF